MTILMNPIMMMTAINTITVAFSIVLKGILFVMFVKYYIYSGKPV